MTRLAPAIVLGGFVDIIAACGPTPPHAHDAPPATIDTRPADARGPDAAIPRDAPAGLEVGPYVHAIAIDGVDDFTSVEDFGTTSATYGARVTWDATTVYVGYSGQDIGAGSATKWVFAYVDVDPQAGGGAATGATTSVKYNTQSATFPAGFGAELYARWKTDGSFGTIETYAASAWTTSATALTVGHQGSFMELAIPRALLGGATTIGLVTWMINEANGVEGTYAGLFPGNFVDGVGQPMGITKYLKIDFTASRVPNDPANIAP